MKTKHALVGDLYAALRERDAAERSRNAWVEKAAALTEALTEIAAVRYGLDLGASDDEARIYWLARAEEYRGIARAALDACREEDGDG